MSIVDPVGARVFLAPEPDRARPVRSERVRARNRGWLEDQRRLGLTVRELARHLGVAVATLGQGLLWAEEEEDRAEAAEVERERREMSPVLDEASGIDLDDIIYLVSMYPPDSVLMRHPMVRELVDPLVAKARAILRPELGPAGSPHADGEVDSSPAAAA